MSSAFAIDIGGISIVRPMAIAPVQPMAIAPAQARSLWPGHTAPRPAPSHPGTALFHLTPARTAPLGLTPPSPSHPTRSAHTRAIPPTPPNSPSPPALHQLWPHTCCCADIRITAAVWPKLVWRGQPATTGAQQQLTHS